MHQHRLFAAHDPRCAEVTSSWTGARVALQARGWVVGRVPIALGALYRRVERLGVRRVAAEQQRVRTVEVRILH